MKKNLLSFVALAGVALLANLWRGQVRSVKLQLNQ